jgi:hypothetical protein
MDDYAWLETLIPDTLEPDFRTPPTKRLTSCQVFDKHWLLFEQLTEAYIDKDWEKFSHTLSGWCTLLYIASLGDRTLPERFDAVLQRPADWQSVNMRAVILRLLADVAVSLLRLDLDYQKTHLYIFVRLGDNYIWQGHLCDMKEKDSKEFRFSILEEGNNARARNIKRHFEEDYISRDRPRVWRYIMRDMPRYAADKEGNKSYGLRRWSPPPSPPSLEDDLEDIDDLKE